jgi:ribosomal protein S18 acetylase RimI-like enzyme
MSAMPAKSNRLPIRFRPARRDEATLIRDFQVEMAFESEKMRLDPVTCLSGVEAVFADPSKGTYWVAEATGVVGCTLVQTEWSDWRNRTVLWVHSLYVRPELRGRGVYRQMYEALQERVRGDDALGGIRLYVDRTNELGILAYEKLGMSREHYHLYEWMKPSGPGA